MFGKGKADWELTPDEIAERTARVQSYESFHSEMAKYNNSKPDAPFINLGNLKSLVKELLDRHFRKIAITTAISLVVSAIFTWLVWPKSESQKLADAKAAAEKMETELQKAKEEAARLAKEKEELLMAKSKEVTGQKQTEAQDVKNEVPKPENKNKRSQSDKKWDTWIAVISSILFLVLGVLSVLSFKLDWNGGLTVCFAMISFCALVLAVAGIYLLSSADYEQSDNLKIAEHSKVALSSEIKNSAPVPKFKVNAVILCKVVRFDKFWSYSFDVQLNDGQKGRLLVDKKFFDLAKCGERIAIYENDDFQMDTPKPEEKKEEPKKPEEKPKKKERRDY